MTPHSPFTLSERLDAIESELARIERAAMGLDALARLAQMDGQLQLAAALDVLSEAQAESVAAVMAILADLYTQFAPTGGAA